MTTRTCLRVFRLVDYESTTISEKALRELQDREAQKCSARHLQEPAPQTAPGMIALLVYDF